MSGTEDPAALAEELKRLQAETAKLHTRRKFLDQENEKLREKNAQTQKEIEAEEESITNRLNKKLNALHSEKEQLAREIEQEEEYLTQTLQAKLEQLRREKVDIENQLEQEQEYVVNKLQRQLEELKHEKRILKRRVEELSRSTTPRSNVTPVTSRPTTPPHRRNLSQTSAGTSS
mmetsp:Transcript_6885/g.20945  ORF Transcript_6885/g.20945 Transcript_6885/m.20945 type:complete len:175 (+) Transcript_6885:114-638(+)